MKHLFFLIPWLILSLNAISFDRVDVAGLFNIGFGLGGESLYQDQDAIDIYHAFHHTIIESRDINIRAGEGVYIGGGFLFNFPDHHIELQSTLSYFDSYDEFSNGDYGFSKVPLDLLIYFNASHHRLGAGLTYHMNPELVVDYGVYNFSVNFKNALGYVVEYNYGFDVFRLFARYVFINYEENETPFHFEANGDSFQFGVSWVLW